MSGIIQDVSDANYKEFTDSPGAVVAYGAKAFATTDASGQFDLVVREIDVGTSGTKALVMDARGKVLGRCRRQRKLDVDRRRRVRFVLDFGFRERGGNTSGTIDRRPRSRSSRCPSRSPASC